MKRKEIDTAQQFVLFLKSRNMEHKLKGLSQETTRRSGSEQ
ncbi:MAG TPA: hypothetical protein V6D06_03640 [Trichocoleus sp.]